MWDAESLVFDENNEYVIGYKTFSGETYPVYSYEEFKEITGYDSEQDEPSITPAPSIPGDSTPAPLVPAGTAQAPAQTIVTPTPADDPSQPNTVSNASAISIKKASGFTMLYKGNAVVSKYKLKNSVLTWNGNGKTRTYKGVKSAGFIKKSNNLIFITKKGKAFTVSPNGKKKTVVKKGAKKLALKSGFVTKVKKKSGSLNVTDK